MSGSVQSHHASAINRRRSRAFDSLLLAILCVIVSGMLWYPASMTRPTLDSDGHPVFRANGRPAFETDWTGELLSQWPGYSCLALAAFFFGRAIVIRFKPLPPIEP